MSRERESRPNLFERARADLLKPPTKAEMLALGGVGVWLSAVVGGVIYGKITGYPPPAYDLLLGSGIVVGGMYLLDRLMDRILINRR